MRIHTDQFSFSFHICDHIVDGNFCSCSCSCRNGNDWNTGFCCRRHTLQTSYVFKFRICNDNTDCLCGIHRRTAANCNNVICFGSFECGNTILYIFDGRVCFDVRINFISKPSFVKNVCHLSCDSEFDQIRIRADECFFESSCLCFCCNFLDCSCPMIRCFVQHNSICHLYHSPLF